MPFDVMGPALPDSQDIVPAFQAVLQTPERLNRARDSPSRPLIFLVEAHIDRGPGAIILAHGVDRVGIGEAATVFGKSLFVKHRTPATEIECLGVGSDQA